MREAMRLLLGIGAGLLAGCGEPRSVDGGGATETENAIRIATTSESGAPLAGARVVFVRTDTWLRDIDSLGAPRTFERIADAQGRILLDTLPEGRWAAQSSSWTSGGVLPLRRDTSWQHLRIQPLVDVVLETPSAAGRRLFAVGTDWSARFDPRGRSFLRLPPGRRALVADLDTLVAPVATVSVLPGRSIDTTIALEPRRVVLDDFSSEDGTSTLWQYARVGGWIIDPWGSTVLSSSNGRGRLSLRFAPEGSSDVLLTTFQFRLGSAILSMDLSDLDSACFSLRADPSVSFYLIHYNSDRSWDRSASTPLADIDTVRSRHQCVVPDSLDGDWPAVRGQVTAIGFMARGGGLLEVSALELWGVRLRDLTP